MNFYVTSITLAIEQRRLDTAAKAPKVHEAKSEEPREDPLVAAAYSVVEAATDYVKLPGHAPFAEPSAYVLFIGTLCLIAAMPTTTDDDERRFLATKILEAFFLMTRIACPTYVATSVYLHHIYVSLPV